MRIIWLLGFLLCAAPASAETGFAEKYERDYNIFNPASRYAPDNPLNPADRTSLTIPFALPGRLNRQQ